MIRKEKEMILDTITVDVVVPDHITDEAAVAALNHLNLVNLARQFSDMGTGLLRGAIEGVFVRPSLKPIDETVWDEEMEEVADDEHAETDS